MGRTAMKSLLGDVQLWNHSYGTQNYRIKAMGSLLWDDLLKKHCLVSKLTNLRLVLS